MTQENQDRFTRAAIVGAGSIGSAFAVVFASAGLSVALYDPDASSREKAEGYITRSLNGLHDAGLIDEPVAQIKARIRLCDELSAAVEGAQWIHECAPEKLETKRAIFQDLDRLAATDAIIVSATSAIPASQIAADLPGRDRCLVAHPGNPPFLLRVLELVPAPFTGAEALNTAEAFTNAVGLSPIVVRKEIEGFVFNRLQGALLREAYCLVRDGVASVNDIDTLVREGLGLRWSVIGPFETADLNTRGGIGSHAEKLGPAYARMGRERGQDDPWTADLVDQVERERRALLPMAQWAKRVDWRDLMLMQRLAAASSEGDQSGDSAA